MNHPVQGSLVEGVSDEAVLIAGGLLCICLAFIFFELWKSRCRYLGVRVHPSQEHAVEQARSFLSNSDHSEGIRNGRPRVSYNADSRCPICILDPRAPVETNCGHIFCAECIITYWKHGSWLGPMNCPICRQEITILFPNYEDGQETDVSVDITTYNRRFSGEPRSVFYRFQLWDYVQDFPTLLRHFVRECFTVNGMIALFRVKIVVCVVIAMIYVLSPFDIIPEAVFGILGLLDDLLIIVVILIYVTMIYRNIIANR
ncbi:E3 ubiquitin-protein ligase RNF170 [Trichoplax sp. H2]|uniref:E3 ubiquitin-protein ligase RNF170 n=1 Tax=Trichoplax adhaerens TaxID=10228 RepID=B3S1P2_TRIAD|nr:hypothetical protein TRIADDRAFT_57833 [Trichoplax adhaerens]EDV23326.1 hypothetical protein TRIADDRAFT_57833 [Trichoplax adhaerens]RDD46147.1 E3 ubiquitin-protein ligase RNF170 [Trichoplax sp. H2]|eukprot:XP_002114236.1 hypothetical protein TRIADDRAFT_57833 [Trichoplax adhaerens]